MRLENFYFYNLGKHHAKNNICMFSNLKLSVCQKHYKDYLNGWDDAQLEMVEENV